jgi:rod shape-determining protein MreC
MVDRARGGHRRYILVLMALTAVTLATLSQRDGDRGPIGAAGRVAHQVVQPVSDAANSVFSPVHDWWHALWHRGDVVSENRKLRRELQAETAKVERNEQALEQLPAYKRFFGQTYWSDYTKVGATVVGDSVGNNETTVRINRGTEAGIADGMAVVDPRGLIGQIVQAWHGGAKVLLVTDPSFGVGAQTLVGSHEQIAQTDDEGVLRLTFAGNDRPHDESPSIKVRDEIVTCGCSESHIPPGIPIGPVANVSVSFDGSVIRVAVAPTLDRSSLDMVEVILWKPGATVPPAVTTKLFPPPPHATTTTTKPSTSTSTSSSTTTAPVTTTTNPTTNTVP